MDAGLNFTVYCSVSGGKSLISADINQGVIESLFDPNNACRSCWILCFRFKTDTLKCVLFPSVTSKITRIILSSNWMYLQMVVPRPVGDCYYTFILRYCAVKFHCSKTFCKDCVHISTSLAGFSMFVKDSVENCEGFDSWASIILAVRCYQLHAVC